MSQGPWKPSSCATSTGAGLPQAKNVLRLCLQGRFRRVQLSATLWTVACQPSLSERGVLQARTLEPIGQDWFPCLLGHYFLLPEPPAPLRTWCCQNPCDPSSCTASAPGPQGANPSPPGQPQEQTPGDGPHAEVEIKPQVKPRGGVAKEEDPTAPHQLYKPQVKSTRSTRQTLSLRNI